MQAKPSDQKLSQPSDYMIFQALGLILVISIASGSFFFASYWVDECISIWVSRDGISNALSRAFQYQGQSGLYYSLLSLWISAFGASEVATRSLSLFLIFLCLYFLSLFLFQSKKSTATLSATALACFLFISQDSIQLALSARPYCLGILFCILTANSFYKFLNNNNQIIAATIYASAAIYSHYFSAFTIAGIILGIFILIRRDRLKLRYLLLSMIGASLLCLPLWPHVKLLASKSAEISFAPPLSLLQAIESFFPLFPSLAFLVGCASVATYTKLPIQKLFSARVEQRELLVISLCAWVLPGFLLLIISLLSGSSFVIPRYLSFSAPFFAVVAGLLISSVKQDFVRPIVLITVAMLSIREINRSWLIENWREALVASDSQIILLAPGLAESNQISWLKDPLLSTQEYLTSPAEVYSPAASTKAIPSALASDQQRQYLTQEIKNLLAVEKQIKIIFYSLDNDYRKRLSKIIEENNFNLEIVQQGLVASALIRRND